MIVQYWITTPTGSRMLRRSQRQFHLRWRLEQKAWKAETNVLWHSSTIVCDMSANCRSVGMLPSWLGACAFTASIPFTWSRGWPARRRRWLENGARQPGGGYRRESCGEDRENPQHTAQDARSRSLCFAEKNTKTLQLYKNITADLQIN